MSMGDVILHEIGINVVRAKVLRKKFRSGWYTMVIKEVPIEWLNKDLVIIRRDELEEVLTFIDDVLNYIEYLERKREVVKKAVKIKLTRDDFNFRLRR